MFEGFTLIHEEGTLIAEIIVNGQTYRKDVTRTFVEGNAHDDWLDYRIDKKFNPDNFRKENP